MTALAQQLLYRIKAVLAATFIALVGVAEWLVQDPDTATAIRSVVPQPYDQFVPILLGVAGTVLVHQIPIGAKPTAMTRSSAPVTELTDSPATTAIPTITDHDRY